MEYKRKPKNHGVYIFFMTSCVRNCAMMEWYIFVSAMVLFGEIKKRGILSTCIKHRIVPAHVCRGKKVSNVQNISSQKTIETKIKRMKENICRYSYLRRLMGTNSF